MQYIILRNRPLLVVDLVAMSKIKISTSETPMTSTSEGTPSTSEGTPSTPMTSTSEGTPSISQLSPGDEEKISSEDEEKISSEDEDFYNCPNFWEVMDSNSLTAVPLACKNENIRKYFQDFIAGQKDPYFHHILAQWEKLAIKTYSIKDEPDLILVLINGKFDWYLLRMAARCGMPREHPVIINTRTGEVFASGFFPKFENNDDHKASFIEKATRAKSLTVSRKWSGYLSGIKIFRRRDGSFGFIVTSKKSADETVYVREGRKLWESMLDQETLRIIYESGVDSLWAKTLTKKDQVHGNVVRIETIVITGAGKILKKGDKRPPNHRRQ
jgi:hypothetical protein